MTLDQHVSVRTKYNSAVLDEFDEAKRVAAKLAVDKVLDLDRHHVVGIGSGTTIVYVAQEIKKRIEKAGYDPRHRLHTFVPTGWQSRALCVENGLPVVDLLDVDGIDIAFDGADDLDPHLNVVKGGGACLLQEKIVMKLSAYNVIVADERKESAMLMHGEWRQGVPVEIIPQAVSLVCKQLATAFDHPLCAKLRQGGPGKAGPVVTDNGNFVLDVSGWSGRMMNPSNVAEVESKMKMMTGIVEVGLFSGLVDEVFVGFRSGAAKRHLSRRDTLSS
ncbi:ribose-5-phosphate isomerase rki1 [Microbotryomycetes sp. JL201]|nr:ribose-5-phosphate isomerase rki1 [Microbotryomycetes sp. JL201]